MSPEPQMGPNIIPRAADGPRHNPQSHRWAQTQSPELQMGQILSPELQMGPNIVPRAADGPRHNPPSRSWAQTLSPEPQMGPNTIPRAADRPKHCPQSCRWAQTLFPEPQMGLTIVPRAADGPEHCPPSRPRGSDPRPQAPCLKCLSMCSTDTDGLGQQQILMCQSSKHSILHTCTPCRLAPHAQGQRA